MIRSASRMLLLIGVHIYIYTQRIDSVFLSYTTIFFSLRFCPGPEIDHGHGPSHFHVAIFIFMMFIVYWNTRHDYNRKLISVIFCLFLVMKRRQWACWTVAAIDQIGNVFGIGLGLGELTEMFGMLLKLGMWNCFWCVLAIGSSFEWIFWCWMRLWNVLWLKFRWAGRLRIYRKSNMKSCRPRSHIRWSLEGFLILLQWCLQIVAFIALF